MTTILILSCGTRNKLVRFFKEAFHSLPGGGRVIVTDCSPWAPALYEADAFYLVPPMKDPGYEDRILEICMREQVNALLPLFEDELDLLAQNRKKYEEKGITAIVSDAESVAVCRDKYGFFSLLQKNGLPVLYTSASLEEFDSDYAEGKIAFPVFVKPVRGCGSVGISRVDNRELLGVLCRYSKEPLLIQQYADGEEFGADMELLLDAGAQILGGCCGTTPEHIRKMTHRLAGRPVPVHGNPTQRALTSERASLTFDLDGPFLIVGERINPTGKKKLQQELREGSFELVTQFAQEQEERGASILDVNMGMSGIDEKAMMLQALEEVAGVTKLPLSIDSSHVDVQEEALRRYPGRALINSISLESEKFEKLLPLAKKYGAMFVLLPLSDEGLPKNLNEKISIIEKIVARALELGMKKTDIIVDGLVATVGANKQAALETLETIRYCHRNGLATTCGLSNISFGLPERSCVNSAFLTMAIASGLTMAIANPSQDILVGAAFASDLLLNKEDSDIRYIEFSGQAKERREEADAKKEALLRQSLQASEGSTVTANQPGNTEVQDGAARQKAAGAKTPQQQAAERVREAVLKGKRKIAEDLTKKALEAGNSPQELLHGQLLPAINEVGELFDKGKYFLPQLIASAETMKLCIGILEPLLLKDQTSEKMPVVVIATVAGDIHDIGKNLVALMLKNYGFQVIDLGKDVPKEKIIEATIEHNAQIIALSALMTTTMQEMRNVVEYAKEKGVTAKIMIGGAVITQDYADEIHADGYSRDAADAVRLAKRLVGMQE